MTYILCPSVFDMRLLATFGDTPAYIHNYSNTN